MGHTPVAVVSPGGTAGSVEIHYLHSDQLNSPRAVVSPGGVLRWRWDGEPFGATAANADADADGTAYEFNLRFPGQYFDKETGLHYNYFRDYDPNTGRYVQADPIGLDGGSMSLYTYADQNPLSNTDPTGLQFVLPGGGAAGGFGGLGGFGGNSGGRSSSGNDPYGGLGQYMGGGSTSGSASGSSSSSSAQQEQCKQPCPPCKLADGTVVAIGTIGYRWDKLPPNVVQHGIAGDHLNLYEVNQNPNNCKCFWKRGPTVRPPPLPGWIPIQPLM